MNSEKIVIISLGVVFLIGFIIWFINTLKPLPGTKIDDLGRGHVPIGIEVKYNSNPPTSGPHYEEWTRAGIFKEVLDDRNLVHSLEHGYVIMSYNCSYYAHGLEEEGFSAPLGTTSATLSEEFKTEDCHKLVDNLISIYEAKGQKKLIITPRVDLDAQIGLTAWNYLDKLNSYDKVRIETFIDAHRGNGPEATME